MTTSWWTWLWSTGSDRPDSPTAAWLPSEYLPARARPGRPWTAFGCSCYAAGVELPG